MTTPSRHRWVKLMIHVYMCLTCGTGRTNFEKWPGTWSTRWTLPDGTKLEQSKTPPCVPGPQTAAKLDRLTAWLKDHPEVRA